MGKIALITGREYFTRVRKKSFIIMTIVGPLLIASFYGIMIYLMVNDEISQDKKVVYVVDKANHLHQKLEPDELMDFVYAKQGEADTGKAILEGYDGRLTIPENLNENDPTGITYHSSKSVALKTKEKISGKIAKVLTDEKMLKHGIRQSVLDSLATNVQISSFVVDEDGNEKNASTEVNTMAGIILSVIIYMFIFLYGVQVMRGVIEEKTNRIVEVIVSSVKPFELMMGKVFGLALVGLTQILMWVVLSMILIPVITSVFMGDMGSLQEMVQQNPAVTSGQIAKLDPGKEFFGMLMTLNFRFIISAFIFYFIGGYLMYSALFAAVGSAVDAETDTQQFMFPITIPLVVSIMLSTSVVMNDPNGSVSFWLSIIPLCSPIVMMVRAPFMNLADQWWEVALSMGLLILTFCFTIWLAGRIYRTGILMYGKKATYKELFKWLFYRS
ncbi:MAG: ABC transporter permease [Bacteroidetes bacterium]|nr:ABC transporter permease [Bacteroidota bacterium]